MSDGRHLKSLVLIPKLKYFHFGPKTKAFIKAELMKREMRMKQDGSVSFYIGDRRFDFRIREADPDGGFIVPSTAFSIPSYGPITKIPDGHWWRY